MQTVLADVTQNTVANVKSAFSKQCVGSRGSRYFSNYKNTQNLTPPSKSLTPPFPWREPSRTRASLYIYDLTLPTDTFSHHRHLHIPTFLGGGAGSIVGSLENFMSLLTSDRYIKIYSLSKSCYSIPANGSYCNIL